MYGAATAPTGFLLCDGTSYTTAGQAALFAVIGYSFGGSGANFNVPDLRGLYPRGLLSVGETIGTKVGTALTASENRAVGQHNHSGITTYKTTDGVGVATTMPVGAASVNTSTTAGGDVSNTTSMTTVNAGSVAGTNAPYLLLQFVIKT